MTGAFLLLQSAWGLVLPQAAYAAPASVTWTERADFEYNASSLDATTTRYQVDTVTSPGDVKLSGPAITAGVGSYHALGLRADGTVMGNGWSGWEYAWDGSQFWTDIVAVTGGEDHTVGLRSDGTVVAVGNGASGLNTDGWTDIKAIAAGLFLTVGLKTDGTVVAAGNNYFGETVVGTWDNITAVAAGRSFTLGLQSDGTVIGTGEDGDNQITGTASWTGIEAIAAGAYHSVGLKADGTVVAVGNNDHYQCDVGGWTDVVAISAEGSVTLGLTSAGTVLATGDNFVNNLDVGTWTDIAEVWAGWDFTLARKTDGTFIVTGDPEYDDVPPMFASSTTIGVIGWGTTAVGLRADLGASASLDALNADFDALRSGETVKFAVRLSSDGVTWGNPLGYDGNVVSWNSGTGTYFGQAFGDPSPRTDLSALPGARYVQIVVMLEGDGGTSPVLHSISLDYDDGIGATFDMSFNSNGGSSVTTQTVAAGSFATTPTPDPTRAGYTFAGWFADPALTDPWDFTTDPVTGDTTLYAAWTINSYTVAFESNGGTSVPPQTVEYGSVASTPTPDPTRAGYTFAGWFADPALTDPWDFTTDPVTGDTTLYAAWTIDSYTVAFESNGGTSVPAQTVEYGSVASTPTPDPTRAGYTFAGWFADPALTDPWDFTTDPVTGDVTLYAAWTPIAVETYLVTFVDWNGSVISTQSVEAGDDAVAPTAPLREGYTFTGWDTDFTNVTGPLTVTALYAKNIVTFVRHAGVDRYDTASIAAVRDFPGGADIAIIATGENFPDALTASGLAGTVNAPILLTRTASLSPGCAAALKTLNVKKVYIVGGPKAVSAAVESTLARTYAVERLGGADRYGTAELIAHEAIGLGASRNEMFLAFGGNFPDALGVSSIAAQRKIPVLLTPTGGLHGTAVSVIRTYGTDEVFIAGGTTVVSPAVAAQVTGLGAAVTRWAGHDRYDTAAAVITNAKVRWSLQVTKIGIASGANFPDALAGGAAMGRQAGLLLLSMPVSLSPQTEPIILASKTTIVRVEFFGGLKALSQSVQTRVQQLLL